MTLALQSLEIRTGTTRSGTVVLTLCGEFDISNAAETQEALLRESNLAAHDLICDISKVTFIDSAGLCTLIRLQREAIKRGNTMRIALGDNQRLRRLLNICGLDRVFTVLSTPAV